MVTIRDAIATERAALESLQRRSSDIREAYREQLAAMRAARDAAAALEVTAGPAHGFYEKLGFAVIGEAETRFGPAVRMRRDLRAASRVIRRPGPVDGSGRAAARDGARTRD